MRQLAIQQFFFQTKQVNQTLNRAFKNLPECGRWSAEAFVKPLYWLVGTTVTCWEW